MLGELSPQYQPVFGKPIPVYDPNDPNDDRLWHNIRQAWTTVAKIMVMSYEGVLQTILEGKELPAGTHIIGPQGLVGGEMFEAWLMIEMPDQV